MRKYLFYLVLSFPMYFSSCITTMVIWNKAETSSMRKNTQLKIVMTNDSIVRGTFTIPKENTKEIKVRLNDKETIKIKSEDIAYIEAWNKNMDEGQFVKLKYSLAKEYKNVGNLNDYSTITTKKKKWLLLAGISDDLSIYIDASEYKLQSNGILMATRDGNFYYQRTGEDIPLKMPKYMHNFKKALMKYFYKCPIIMDKISKNRLNMYNYETVLDEYKKCSEAQEII